MNMSVKVMGIAAGRKDSNNEILLKEALMYCEEAGAEVTMINLKDYKILDCTVRCEYQKYSKLYFLHDGYVTGKECGLCA